MVVHNNNPIKSNPAVRSIVKTLYRQPTQATIHDLPFLDYWLPVPDPKRLNRDPAPTSELL